MSYVPPQLLDHVIVLVYSREQLLVLPALVLLPASKRATAAEERPALALYRYMAHNSMNGNVRLVCSYVVVWFVFI